METFSLFIPLLLAFSSGLHCLGMCGGIVGAMTFRVSSVPVAQRKRVWLLSLAANMGRLVSYAVAGALVTLFGHALFTTLSPGYGHLLLQGLAGIILVGNGLFLIGRFPHMHMIEQLGSHLWLLLEPFAKRFMTPQTLLQAFVFGLVWGWFPCSLVYGTLLWSSGSCSVLSGAVVMLLFGAGTLPVMLSAGWLVGYVVHLGGLSRVGHFTAWILLAIGILNLILLGWTAHNSRLHELSQTVNCLIPP
ncbi:MAG: sulfite exporter TauE/SafE family protein [Magnetococcales bacterium]|nr:sulfite exporter TauE/SafE family protein [Magnetococcales bacterium]